METCDLYAIYDCAIVISKDDYFKFFQYRGSFFYVQHN